jgi:hypothetical protein
MLRNRFPEQCALKDPAVACLHWTSLAEGNANFSIVIVFRYADDLMAGFEHREEAERLQGINQHASRPQSTQAEGGQVSTP